MEWNVWCGLKGKGRAMGIFTCDFSCFKPRQIGNICLLSDLLINVVDVELLIC